MHDDWQAPPPGPSVKSAGDRHRRRCDPPATLMLRAPVGARRSLIKQLHYLQFPSCHFLATLGASELAAAAAAAAVATTGCIIAINMLLVGAQ